MTSPTFRTRYWYARARWAGRMSDILYRFETIRARDVWVARGGSLYSRSNYREPVPAAEVRKLLRGRASNAWDFPGEGSSTTVTAKPW